MEKLFFYKLKHDYDENFPFISYRIMSEQARRQFFNHFKNQVKYPYNWRPATNQLVTFRSFEDLENSLYYQEITTDQVKVLCKYINFNEYLWPYG